MAEKQKGPDRIWLEPVCYPERSWCTHDTGPCEECEQPSIEYVRWDLVQTLKGRIMTDQTTHHAEAILRAAGASVSLECYPSHQREAMMHTLAKRLEALDTERASHEATKAELQALREAAHGALLVLDGLPMSGVDAAKLTDTLRQALTRKDA